MTINLDFLPATVFAFLLVFARVGAMVISLPGIGDRNVPVAIRLAFALALTFTLYLVLKERFPPIPPTLWAMLAVFGREVVLGVALGVLIRLVIAGMQLAGTIVGFQTGLSFASSFDPNFGGDGNVVGTFMSMLALTAIFVLDLHHMLLRGIVDSYALFAPMQTLPIGDFGQLAIDIISKAFRIAMQISAPFIVFGLIFYLGVGILARLIPQIQVFFIAQPAAIFISFILLMFMLAGMTTAYLTYFAQSVAPFIAGR